MGGRKRGPRSCCVNNAAAAYAGGTCVDVPSASRLQERHADARRFFAEARPSASTPEPEVQVSSFGAREARHRGLISLNMAEPEPFVCESPTTCSFLSSTSKKKVLVGFRYSRFFLAVIQRRLCRVEESGFQVDVRWVWDLWKVCFRSFKMGKELIHSGFRGDSFSTSIRRVSL